MRKDQQEELRRLEAALLEDRQPQWPQQPEESSEEEYHVYNTDRVDVDLQTYSEEVHRGSNGRGCLTFLAVTLTVILCALILWLLIKLEVIPWLL